MHRTTILSTLALALATRAVAQGIHDNDVGRNCVAVCTNIVNVSDECERQFVDQPNEDQQELTCICTSPGMNTAIPECEACQRQYYGRDDDDDNDNDDNDDIRTLLSRCGFSSMSVTGTMTSMGSAPTGQVTVITSTYTDTDDDDDDDDVLETTTYTSILGAGATTAAGGVGGTMTSAGTAATGAVGSGMSSATDAAGSVMSSATDAAGSVMSSATDAAGSVLEQSGNFAPAITAAPVLAMAGVAAAVFGL